MRKIVFILCLIFFGMVITSCDSFQITDPEPTANADRVPADGCSSLAGTDRLDCIKKINTLCAQAINVHPENKLVSEERQGKYIMKVFELCLVGNAGYKFACYKYSYPSYQPTFWWYIFDYGLPIATMAIGYVIGHVFAPVATLTYTIVHHFL